MTMYNVHNNSPLVDLIVLYLFMRVSLVADNGQNTIALKLTKTKYRNIYQLFAKRFESGAEDFIKMNKSFLIKLKRWFGELEPLDEEDLNDLFTDFVTDAFEISSDRFKEIVASRPVQILSTAVSNNAENQLPVFNVSAACMDQIKSVEIKEDNWPNNQNFICNLKKLQINASFPFFICCKVILWYFFSISFFYFVSKI